ncbi:MAG TPA: M28 family peptidase [Longimicrobiaceae bacterium]|nr:M28 family peptidase [Longimicrobiaceae bacterium]
MSPNASADALNATLARISPDAVDAHLRFLSHPLMEGRGPGTRGGDTAQEYIRAQFRRMGLQPVNGSYVQPVPLVGMDPSPTLSLASAGGTRELAYRDEFVLKAGVPREETSADAEVVFVGYGITAPEYGWDDYGGADVKGKLLLMRVNDPGTEATPGFFGGRALTYYGRWTYKYEEASRRGAAGVLLIHSDESAGYGWNVVRTSNSGEQYDLQGEPEFPLQVKGWVSTPAIAEVLAAAGLDLQDLLRRSEERGFTPVATGIRARAVVRSTVRPVATANVVGLLPGSDPALAAEPVVMAAHYDHLGTTTTANGEKAIYHGAYDNASGVALLLAIAEAAAGMPVKPARPLLFVSTTAEESGLLGSEWYARNPLFPLGRTAAMINVDGANLFGRTRDIGPLGADRSSLGKVVGEAAAAEGMHVTPEAHPEQGMFFRQDHFPLARAGVPALAMDHGLAYEGRPEGWGQEIYREFTSRHYHQPSDAYRDDFDYSGALQQARITLRTALAVADAAELPRWNAGSEFRRG